MVKYFCDRCGVKMTKKEYYASTIKIHDEHGVAISLDLCKYCSKKFNTLLENFKTGELK